MKKIFCLIMLIAFSISANAETKFVVEGLVKDKSNKRTIPGASIRVAGTNRGSYTSSKGIFRLYVSNGDTLLVKSIGYLPEKIIVGKSNINYEIELSVAPVKKGNVDVTAEISANQIIERSVLKRDENLKKLKTFSGELYSKLVMELGGSLVSAEAGQSSFSLSATLSGDEKETPDSRRFIIMETYSDVKRDYEKNINSTKILKRRQTANIPSEQNLMAITEFISFYDDEINFLNTKMPSPIGSKALSTYNFEVVERVLQDDRFIYLISVKPQSDLYPSFEGLIQIVEGSYNIVGVDLKPSKTTSFPFFKNLEIKQNYAESEEKIWYPSYLDISAEANVEILKGLIDFAADIKVTSIFSDAKINSKLPDSLYINAVATNKKLRHIEVSPVADTKDTIFWQNNSLRELSARETEIYSRVDSAVKADTSNSSLSENKNKNFTLSVMPYFDFNRVGSVSLGLSPESKIYGISLYGNAYFSFGLQDYFGTAGIALPGFAALGNWINISSEVYSKQSEFGTNAGKYSRLINSVAAAIVHEDYFDYYGSTGFEVNIALQNKYFNLDLTGKSEHHDPLFVNTNQSIFEDYKWRKNILAPKSDYKFLLLDLSSGDINPLQIQNDFDAEFSLSGFLGAENNANDVFDGISSRLSVLIPTFSTGYNPMTLQLTLSAGITSDNAPVQFQHRMGTRLFVLNNVGNFFTAPLGLYGGDKFYSIDAKYNLTDLWWRWLGLPTFEGRGLDLILGGSWGRFYNSTGSAYRETGDDGYTEVGFGFSRIPTFISNVAYWSFDLRYGIGKNADGRIGGALNISLPF